MQNSYSDKIIQRSLFALLVAEVIYLGTLSLKMSFSSCAYMMISALGMIAFAGLVRDILTRGKGEKKVGVKFCLQQYPVKTILLLTLILLQIIWNYIICSPTFFGDLTGETMQSFLTTDRIYSVNPMTGEEFLVGMPNRLKIISLPAVYAAIAKVLQIPAPIVCYKIIPILVCILSYLAFERVGECLYGEDKNGKLTFLLLVSILFLFGSYGLYADGARLFVRGWQGETIRNLVLLPFTMQAMLRKKYASVLLAVMAEVCIVWTFYGLGLSLLMAVLLWLAGKVVDKK